MEDFFKYFSIAFVVGFLGGMANGCKQSNHTTDMELLQQTVIDHLHYKHVEIENGFALGEPCLRLSYACKGIEYYVHFLSKSDDHGEYIRTIEHKTSTDSDSALGEDLEQIFVTATGLHANEIIVFLSRGKLAEDALTWNKSKVIGVLLGTATGFFAGRWITARGQPACDSPKLLAGLKDNSLWLSSNSDDAEAAIGKGNCYGRGWQPDTTDTKIA